MKLFIQLDPVIFAAVTLEIKEQGTPREPTLSETLATVHALQTALLIDTPGSRISTQDPEIPF